MKGGGRSCDAVHISGGKIGCFHNQIVREECVFTDQRGCPHVNRCPQAELPTGGLEDTEPSAPAADRRRRARFGGWLSGTVSGRPACEQSPRDDQRRSIQARRHARSRPTPRPDRAVRAGMMGGCGEHASGTAAHSQGRSRLSREGRGSGRVRESRGARRACARVVKSVYISSLV